jgi:hypothetical protein
MSENNVVDLAAEAQKRGKFNLADVVKGRGFPEKSVDIYLDANSAYELEELNLLMNTTVDADELAKLEPKAAELKKKIIDSCLTFHMRGVSQYSVEYVTEEADKLYPDNEDGTENPNWIRHYLAALVAKNIVKITDAEGNEDTDKLTTEQVLELRGVMPIDAWTSLVETMQKLTLASSYFEAITDAGFLPKS